MKETQIFESWINNLAEGTWILPETPEQKQALIDLLSKDLPVGADATNATEQLYDLLGDDELFDRLSELADANADADARSVILTRMQELADSSTDIEVVLGQLQTTKPAASPADQNTQNMKEADDLSSIEEAQCNMTEAGEHCPEHGLKECGIYEYSGNWTNFGLEENNELARLKKIALGK